MNNLIMTSSAISYVTVFCLCVVYATGEREGQVRLAGPTDNQGRVEVYLDDEWGTVCSSAWGSSDAQVVCKQLGYTDVTASTAHWWGYFGAGTGPIHMTSVYCTGAEEKLIECQFSANVWCDHNDDAGVTCACGEPVCAKPLQDCPYGRTEIVTVPHQRCPICRCASCPYQPKCPTNCKSGTTVYYDGATCRRCKCVPQDLPDVIYETNNISVGMMAGIAAVMLIIPLILLLVVLVYRQKHKKANVKSKPKDKEANITTF